MRPIYKIFSVLFLLLFYGASNVLAQCAMCRATVENNISNGGDTSMGAGLNFGIIYLFSMPYLIIGIVGFLWYRKSKANARNKQFPRYIQR